MAQQQQYIIVEDDMKEVESERSIDFKAVFAALRKRKRLYAYVLSIAFVLSCIFMLSIPKYYSCEVKLAPELATDRTRSSISSLALQFGMRTGTAALSGSEALYPILYPDLVKSTDFKISLFDVPVHKQDEANTMTYYDYLKNEQKSPWWSSLIGGAMQAIMSLLPTSSEPYVTGDGVDPFRLTKEQTAIAQLMDSKMVCAVDDQTMIITIAVYDQDPLICATIADTVQTRLQHFITDYRTKKARIDLENIRMLEQEAKHRYDEARKEYAVYADANQDIVLQSERTKLLNLENEMQLKYNRYNLLAQSVMAAESKIQEETPSFTTLQRATVPVLNAGPHRTKGVLIALFVAFFCTTLWILYKENQLSQFFDLS